MPLVLPPAADSALDARLRGEIERSMARIPAMMHSIDADGRLTFVSDAWLDKLGYSRDEVLGRRSSEFLTEASREYARNVVLPAFFRTGRCDDVHYQMVRKDGSIIDVVLNAVVQTDAEGRQSSIAVLTDVTAMTTTRRQLADSEARYRFLTENSTDLIMLVDAYGRRAYVSPACEALFGYTPEEMLALNSRDCVHPDDAERVLAALATGMTEPDPVTMLSYRMLHKDGSTVWVETTGRVVDVPGENGLRLVIIRGIEQRRQAEQQLRDSEARYRLLAENSTDMVFQLDRELVRRYVSPACRELLGYAPEAMVGIRPTTMIHPDEAACLGMAFDLLLGGALDQHTLVNRIRHHDGRWIWVEARLRALKDPATGGITGIIGALRDISGRKRIEDELAAANGRLRALVAEDGLTGLANRRGFDEALAREHQRCRREHAPLALIMIDVDHFKAFNDDHGHPAGDECLRRVAQVIAQSIARPADLAARYGGEEFAVLLPNTDEEGAALIAERIAGAVIGLGIVHAGSACGLVTVSAGVGALDCAGDDGAALIAATDRALYRAKDFGRNAVIRASEVPPAVPRAAVA